MYNSPNPNAVKRTPGQWVLSIMYASGESSVRYFTSHSEAANVRDFIRKLPRITSTTLHWEQS